MFKTIHPICIAIDGPSASGKSTVARRVAAALGFVYVDSGAMYRGLTWYALRQGVNTAEPEHVVAALAATQWTFEVVDGALKYRICGHDPGEAVREAPVREHVSEVAAIPEVRSFLVERFREAVKFGPLVMEGRDIGTVVFPESPFKFYLDADPEVRARRRLQDIVQLEGQGDVRDVRDSLARRDQRDRSRATAPLQIALNAVVIDSSSMNVDQVVAFILEQVRNAGGPDRKGGRH